MLCCWFSMRSNLNLWRPFLVAILLIFSSASFADTTPAVFTYYAGNSNFTTVSAACSYYASGYPNQAPFTASTNSHGQPLCLDKNQSTYSVSISAACPQGGNLAQTYYIVGSTCNNVPSCSSGQVRNSGTEACQTPPICNFGTSYYNSSNSCTPIVCTGGQQLIASSSNPSGTCSAPPTKCGSSTPICTSVEQTCTRENGTILLTPACAVPPTCSAGFHADALNTCVADAQFGCPQGQHANSTNNGCVADDPQACPSGTYKGYINGQPQCIAGSNPNPANAGNPTPDTPSQNIGEVTTTNGGTTTTTINKDASGAVIGSQVSTTTGSTSSSEIKLDTTGLAKNDTLQGILDGVNKSSGKSAQIAPGVGVAPSDSNAATIASDKAQFNAMVSGIKTQFAGLSPSFSSGGSLTCEPISVPSLHINLRFCLSDYSQYFVMMGNAVYFVAAVIAMLIILG